MEKQVIYSHIPFSREHFTLIDRKTQNRFRTRKLSPFSFVTWQCNFNFLKKGQLSMKDNATHMAFLLRTQLICLILLIISVPPIRLLCIVFYNTIIVIGVIILVSWWFVYFFCIVVFIDDCIPSFRLDILSFVSCIRSPQKIE